MKPLLLLLLAFLNYQPPFSGFDSQIYFGKYCLMEQETHWDLVLKDKIFTFRCRETSQEYHFKYNKCSNEEESVKICSTDDKLVTLTFSELKKFRTCEGEEKTHFSKIVFTHGSNTSDTGNVCCDN